jgi:hypothetical protein
LVNDFRTIDHKLYPCLPIQADVKMTMSRCYASRFFDATDVFLKSLLLDVLTLKGGTAIGDRNQHHQSLTAVLFIDFDGTVTSTSFQARLASQANFEPPVNYTGAIHGIWSAANGVAEIREYV